jgi:archaellum component FlaC
MADATSKLNILVKVQDDASSALRRLSNETSDLGGSLNFAGLKAGILAGAMAAISGVAIAGSIKAFKDAEIQAAKFDAIIKTLPPNLQAYRERIIETANAAMRLGFDNDIAAVSIARLFQATGDAEFAFKAFQAAMDLARYKGISLEEATTSLITAFQGGGRLLKQFGIDVDEHASKETILAAVFQKVKGQAEEYAKTLGGTGEVLKQYRGEVMEIIGQPFAEYFKKINEKIIAWVDSQGGINNLLDRFKTLINDIGKTFNEIFGPSINFVKDRFNDLSKVIGWLYNNYFKPLFELIEPYLIPALKFLAYVVGIVLVSAFLSVLTVIGLVGAAFAGFVTGISTIIAGIYWVYEEVRKIWEKLKEYFKDFAEILKNAWQGLVNWFQENIIKWFEDKVKWVSDQVEKLKNLVKSAWETVKSAPSAISSGVQGAVGKVKNVLGFQEGGIVTKPTLGLIGEAGPEAIIPLNKGFGIGGINIYLQGDFYTDAEIAKKFGDILAKEIKYQLKL